MRAGCRAAADLHGRVRRREQQPRPHQRRSPLHRGLGARDGLPPPSSAGLRQTHAATGGVLDNSDSAWALPSDGRPPPSRPTRSNPWLLATSKQPRLACRGAASAATASRVETCEQARAGPLLLGRPEFGLSESILPVHREHRLPSVQTDDTVANHPACHLLTLPLSLCSYSSLVAPLGVSASLCEQPRRLTCASSPCDRKTCRHSRIISRVLLPPKRPQKDKSCKRIAKNAPVRLRKATEKDNVPRLVPTTKEDCCHTLAVLLSRPGASCRQHNTPQ